VLSCAHRFRHLCVARGSSLRPGGRVERDRASVCSISRDSIDDAVVMKLAHDIAHGTDLHVRYVREVGVRPVERKLVAQAVPPFPSESPNACSLSATKAPPQAVALDCVS